MNYSLGLSNRAYDELDAAYQWWSNNRSSNQAAKWYNACAGAIESLTVNPKSCPLSRENNLFPYEIRDKTFGIGRRRTHRLVFKIRGNMVFVIAIRHLAQGDLLPDQFHQQ